MASFMICDIDYDQFGGGGGYSAVEEFRLQLPVTAKLWRQNFWAGPT